MQAYVLSHFNCAWLFVTLWTTARQAPLSMRFSRQEYWNGLPCSPPGDLPNPGIKPISLTSPTWAGGFFTIKATCSALKFYDSPVTLRKAKLLSCVQLIVTIWAVVHQASLSIEFLQATILEWVAISVFRGSSRPRDWTQVSHVAGRLFTLWATREAHTEETPFKTTCNGTSKTHLTA